MRPRDYLRACGFIGAALVLVSVLTRLQWPYLSELAFWSGLGLPVMAGIAKLYRRRRGRQ